MGETKAYVSLRGDVDSWLSGLEKVSEIEKEQIFIKAHAKAEQLEESGKYLDAAFLGLTSLLVGLYG